MIIWHWCKKRVLKWWYHPQLGCGCGQNPATYLQQEVWGIVEAHHQTSYSHHVVDIGEANEADRSQVMDEHDEEVLRGRETGTLTISNSKSLSLCKRSHKWSPVTTASGVGWWENQTYRFAKSDMTYCPWTRNVWPDEMSPVSYKESALAFIWLRLSYPPGWISPSLLHIRADIVPFS